MCCSDDLIQPIDTNMALVCLLLNVLVMPGLGTMIHACMTPTPGAGIIIGLLQLFLSPFFLIGYIWGIVYGVRIYSRSTEHAKRGEGNFYQTQQQ